MDPPVKQRTVSIVFFAIIFVTIWNCDSVIGARLPVYDNFLKDKSLFTNSEWLKSHQRQRSLLSSSKFDRRLSASSRQGGFSAALMAGPALMAASSLLLSLPVLPLLFLTPLVSNLIPSFDDITEEIQSNPQLGEILQGVQMLGQGELKSSFFKISVRELQ
ncbi:uncharacterized protein LOC141849696 [Brevipalpus obovatus]|uniref:uncharacterized protein LOC141849696 n=1 Tax=Brevipalpus obovatus TaxID=246614 RepID=UPI003D9E9B33